jgi:hypothetical protein
MRMIAAIAYMGGYDIKDDQVRSLIYATLAGFSIGDVLKRVGIKFVLKTGESLVSKIPGKIFIEINKKVGYKLLTKFGSKGIINIIKIVPVAGGVLGGGLDGLATKYIGKLSIKNFIADK